MLDKHKIVVVHWLLYVKDRRLQQPRPILILLTTDGPQQKQHSLAGTRCTVSETQQELTLDLVQHQEHGARRVERRGGWSEGQW